MLTPRITEPRRLGAIKRPPMFSAEVLAGDEMKIARLAVCGRCEKNENGVCKQCCGGVPVNTLVRLAASRCKIKKW